MIYFALAFELIAIVFLSYGVEKLWTKYVNARISQFILFPGMVIHVLSHALLCILTGATIKNLNIFKLGKNEILFVKPKIGFIGTFFIAAAPIFGCGLIILILLAIFGGIGVENLPLTNTTGIYTHVIDLLQIMHTNLTLFWRQIAAQNISSIIFLSLAVILSISMSPNIGELKYLVIGFIVCGAIPFSLKLIDFDVYNYALCKIIINKLWLIITLLISVLTAVLCITIILTGVIAGLRLTFSHKASGTKKNSQLSRSKFSRSKDNQNSDLISPDI